MADLERKVMIQPLEWMIVLLTTCIGAQSIIVSNEIFTKAQQFAWGSCILGGVLFGGVTLLMVWLTLQFPGQTIVEISTCLWGRWAGRLVNIWFLLLFLGQICTIVQGFSKVIALFMFDRTPTEVIALFFFSVCVYCALQDVGTIIRIQQFLFATTMFPLLLVWGSGTISMQLDALQPLWPIPWGALGNGALETWNIFSGYEIVFLLGPYLVAGQRRELLHKTCIAFAGMTLLYAFIMMLVIGVLTVAGAQAVPYPSLMVVRSVELPGTFIERLENYLLLTWIPVVFDTIAIMMFAAADILRRMAGHKEHQVMLTAVAPLLYNCAILLDLPQRYQMVGQAILWMGLSFSLGVVPLLAATHWWKLQQVGAASYEE